MHRSIATLCLFLAANSLSAQETARGVVFHDRNNNGRRDLGEKGLAGVRVSNQKEVVVTDLHGRWELPAGDEVTFFVVKPRGWSTPLNHHNLPRFFYTHKPKGSPEVKFGGVPPTGPLPRSIDFPLRKQEEPKSFKALFFGDTQPRDIKEVEYIAHDVVEELIGTDAKFGVTLGDIVFDDLSVFEPLNATIALIGIPWYNVIGNHDINYDVDHDQHSDETYERIYGPNYYSFDYGPVHFIVLDDVKWEGRKPQGTGNYSAGLGSEQIEWVKNNLRHVPDKQLVVLMMHIPLTGVADRTDLYRLIEKRSYCMSISGHTHYQEHRFITAADGWRGPEPHHHVVSVTVCGSWWSGAPDETGVPHAMMSDGAPNGYTVITFDENRPTIDFKAARAPADYQMSISAPEKIRHADLSATPVYANVFGGSERSRVFLAVDQNGPWFQMEKVNEPDPYLLRLKTLEKEYTLPGRKLPEARNSGHIWKALLPAMPPGTHTIRVRAIDLHNREHRGERIVTILE